MMAMVARPYSSQPAKVETESAALSKEAKYDVIRRYGLGNVAVGPGGRSSSTGLTVTVFGGQGVTGRLLVNRHGQRGSTVVVPYRSDDEDVRFLRVMGDLGQIVTTRFHLKDEKSIVQSIRNSHVVYNLIGRNFETHNFSFKDVHVDGARRIARLAREVGVPRFIHVSALNADVNSPSAFLRTKALGEIAVREEFPDATIVRPANIYSQDDWYFNRIGITAIRPHLGFHVPVVNGGAQKIHPIHAGDVAVGLLHLATDINTIGKTVEFYGPEEMTYMDLVEKFYEVSKVPRRVLDLPVPVLRIIAKVYSLLPRHLISEDEVIRMTLDDQIHPELPNLKSLGIEPVKIEKHLFELCRMFSDIPPGAKEDDDEAEGQLYAR